MQHKSVVWYFACFSPHNQIQTHPIVRMADIQKELKQLEEDVSKTEEDVSGQFFFTQTYSPDMIYISPCIFCISFTQGVQYR